MQNIVNYALAYAKKGFSVLPISAGEKRPLVLFADRPPMTESQIKKIWKRHPNARLALRTIEFFVVDIDEHQDGDDGFKSIETFNQKNPGCIVDTLCQTTGHGGKQLFYEKPAGIDMTQVIGWLPGVDIKANPNNYVLVAPSTGYTWQNKMPMVKAPEALINSICKKQSTKYSPVDPQALTEMNWNQKVGQHSRTAKLFEQIVNGLGETGGRNMALAAFVGGLLYRNIDVQVVKKLAEIANNNTAKALDTREFDRTFDSMVKKELRRRANGK
ncbi:bifunctional DNA primase/polymerase [Loigolactobacillus bifermentans]|uniref:DNA primase n=1 Tax=Loigolactobacillus bifermentans DSM 20003 TaxID=1423726 RepID=A0A0R1H0H0_9LACO|nr:bifunctional DNA primase/polymerase [Loigolactobacillus bifermentans]KRK39973.1 hypothetical protein FC07_GL001770 [Loigolactobacillus bifermentans DSM 20003]QGG59668.1 DNA primase [Loigolactobacillus bifermentans]